ncbi:hypothetical protein FB451DRAFT_1190085 [Mycena latifolia]|nr:hypothetical protein FB451DRAFT_1190085 [Mycena latifolia]
MSFRVRNPADGCMEGDPDGAAESLWRSFSFCRWTEWQGMGLSRVELSEKFRNGVERSDPGDRDEITMALAADTRREHASKLRTGRCRARETGKHFDLASGRDVMAMGGDRVGRRCVRGIIIKTKRTTHTGTATAFLFCHHAHSAPGQCTASQDGTLQPRARTALLPRQILTPSAINRPDYLERTALELALVSLHITVIVAGLLCSNREGDDAYRFSPEAMAVIIEWYAAQFAEQYGLDAADSRGGAPRECAGRCACVALGAGVGVPAEPLRLVATTLSALSGGGIRAVCGRASGEPRMHASAGYAARASRAEAALPTDSHSGGSGGASLRIQTSALAVQIYQCASDLNVLNEHANHSSLSGDLGRDLEKRRQVKNASRKCTCQEALKREGLVLDIVSGE